VRYRVSKRLRSRASSRAGIPASAVASFFACQSNHRITTETPQPNANKRTQSSSEVPILCGFSGKLSPLITVCLEVGLLPDSVYNLIVTD